MLRRRSDASASSVPLPFPWFIVMFAAVMVFNSSVSVPAEAVDAILRFDQFLFMMVMVSLGLTTQLSRLGEAGGAARIIGIGAIGLVLSTLIAYVLVAPLSASRAPAPAQGTAAVSAPASGR